MKHRFRCSLWGLALSCALVLAGAAAAQNYMVNSVTRLAIYVSSVSANGIPVGSDSNTGGRSDPYLTLDKAVSVALPSATIAMNGTLASPATYALGTTVTTAYPTLAAVVDYGAIVAAGAGRGTAEAIRVTAGGSLALGNVIVDPSQNADGAAAICVNVPTTPTTTTLSATLTKFRNWTGQCVSVTGGRNTGTFTNAVFEGGNVDGAIFYNGHVVGGLTISGGSCTLTAQKLANFGACVMMIAGTTGITTSISNFAATTTLDPTLTSTGTHYAVRILNVASASVSGGAYRILGAPGARIGASIAIETNGFSIDNASILNVVAENTTNGGYNCLIGEEAVGAYPVAASPVINGCAGTGNTTSAAGGLHCTMLGYTSLGTIMNSTCNNVGIAFVFKNDSGGHATNNTATGFASGGLLAKAANASTFSGNTLTQALGYSGNYFTAESDGGTPSLNVALTSNTFTNNGGIGAPYVTVDLSNTFTPSLNAYNYTSGTQPSTKYAVNTVSPTNYTICSAYKAAVETNAVCNIP